MNCLKSTIVSLLLSTSFLTGMVIHYEAKESKINKELIMKDKEIDVNLSNIKELDNTIKDKDLLIIDLNSKLDESIKDSNNKDKEIENLKGEIESKNNQIEKLKQSNDSNFKTISKGSGGNYDFKASVTAYTAGYESTQKRKGQDGYGITASGSYVQEGRTVACPKSMPFGTVIEIEGIGQRVCEDRGGAITEGHIDLYIEDLGTARSFGRKNLGVKIIN